MSFVRFPSTAEDFYLGCWKLEGKKKSGRVYLRNKLPLCSSGRLVFLGFHLGFEADIGLRLVCAEQKVLWHSSSRGAGTVRCECEAL